MYVHVCIEMRCLVTGGNVGRERAIQKREGEKKRGERGRKGRREEERVKEGGREGDREREEERGREGWGWNLEKSTDTTDLTG